MKETGNMITNTFRMNWLIPLLGIVLVGGGYSASRSYLGLQQKIDAAVQFQATLEHIEDTCSLLQMQAQLQSGGCAGSAPGLDERLSGSVANLDRELASPDEQTRDTLRIFFDFMARHQSQNSPKAARLSADPSVTEMAAQKILAQALAVASLGK